MNTAKKISLGLMSLFYVLAGVNHFRDPDFYRSMMPPYLPAHSLLIILSGVAEIVLGMLILFPRTRRLGAWGLIALLIAVLPANIYMYQLGGAHYGMSDTGLLLRIPAQLLLVSWAYLHRN